MAGLGTQIALLTTYWQSPQNTEKDDIMKFMQKLACVATALAMASSAQAAGILNNWILNTTGVGGAAAPASVQVNEYLDITGNAFIDLTPDGAGGFSFTEHAVFNSPYADNMPIKTWTFPDNGGRQLTATFEATGSGLFSGAFTFATGTIKIYVDTTFDFGGTGGNYGADNSTMIAEFDVIPGGGGFVDGSGNPVGNGQITVFAKATSPGGLLPGYFFRPDGSDLTSEDVLAFAFTNANTVGQTPTTTEVDEIICGYAGFTGVGCDGLSTYQNVGGEHLYVSNNGQFKLGTVPEPSSLALVGIALLGAGVMSRKRAAGKQA